MDRAAQDVGDWAEDRERVLPEEEGCARTDWLSCRDIEEKRTV